MPRIDIPNRDQSASDWIRRKDGLWIPYRKVNYIYWFRLLQIAEKDPKFSVNWRKYKKWGGKKAVMGMSFDNWWREYWKDCFGLVERTDKQKFPFTTTRPKTESIRLSWLCYRFKDVPIKIGTRRNTLDIANAVYRFELGLDSRRKKPRDAVSERFSYTSLDPHGKKMSEDGNFYDVNPKELTDTVNRALKRARETMGRVCEGQFP